MKYCITCGTPLPDEAVFFAQCGASQESITLQEAVVPQPVEPAPKGPGFLEKNKVWINIVGRIVAARFLLHLCAELCCSVDQKHHSYGKS